MEAQGICPDSPKGGSTYGKVRLPNFKMEATFTSQRPRAKSDITIITQCSVDRSGHTLFRRLPRNGDLFALA